MTNCCPQFTRIFHKAPERSPSSYTLRAAWRPALPILENRLRQFRQHLSLRAAVVARAFPTGRAAGGGNGLVFAIYSPHEESVNE